MEKQLTIGISACVMGEQVRFDKGHKKSNFCVDQLGEFATFKPVCPEVGIGLPIPRPTIRQIIRDNIITVSRPDGSGDVTEALKEFGQKAAKQYHNLSGFVFCAKSPSCGMERVKIYHHHGKGSESTGVGIFAEQVMTANPLLPCEENGRLNDPVIKENFITRIFTYQKWLDLKADGLTKHKLIAFHSEHKYLVMSHHVESYRELGRLLARADMALDEQADAYIAGLMAALKHKATRRSHTNTLQHLQGYFKKQLDAPKRKELTEHIAEYREGRTPLLVPLTLIQHYLLEYPNDYLASQTYLNPHPSALRLRYGY
ncbi:YbgA family protein [Shewanella waksmanii]|uniref:YbgA family protein n=1 Tax=Shewanella waksmanii TaxID=213783 RepID=UPI003734F7DE